VISGSSGRADGFQVVRPRSPGVMDMFPALIYASVRWRDGIIDAKTRLQPAQQKTKYLWGDRRTLSRFLPWNFPVMSRISASLHGQTVDGQVNKHLTSLNDLGYFPDIIMLSSSPKP
jgi:hypothetical protein